MDRRTFLQGTGGGLGVAYLGTLTGCQSNHCLGEDGFDPGPYVAGERHLVFDSKGSAYELDVTGHEIHVLGDDGQTVSTFASLGDSAGELNYPFDASIGPDDRLYVLDRGNGRIEVFDLEGKHVASHAAQMMLLPNDLVVTSDRIFVCDTHNHRVISMSLEGDVVTVFGPDGDESSLNGPRGVAVTEEGELHVVDVGDATVEVFSADGKALRKYGGYGGEPGQMRAPSSIAITGGRAFVADPSGGFVNVYELDGTFVGRFRPHTESGECGIPMRVSVAPDGRPYIWTAGLVAGPEA